MAFARAFKGTSRYARSRSNHAVEASDPELRSWFDAHYFESASFDEPSPTEQTRSRSAPLGNRVVYRKERATYASFPRTPAPFFYADGGASRRHEYKTKKRSGTSSHKGLPTPTGRDRKMAMWFLACIIADVASGYPHIRSTITPRLQAHVFVRLLFKYL